MLKPYKRKPRRQIATEKKVAAAARQALKKSVGRPRKDAPVVTVVRPARSNRIVERIEVNVLPEEPKVNKPGRVRGRPFEKGNPNAWKPGQSGNPTGKNIPRGSGVTVISKAYNVRLSQLVPPEVAAAMGYDPEHPLTWAEAMAAGMIERAVTHDTTAAKEVREVTEGKLPERIDLAGQIDYTAGQDAKARLLGKLLMPKNKEK